MLSPIGFSILSGAGLFKDPTKEVHVHTTSQAYVSNSGTIDLTDVLGEKEEIDGTAPVFVMVTESDGSITGDLLSGLTTEGKMLTGASKEYFGKTVFVDFYIVKESETVSELQIDAEHFAGNYYVEASTLFRRQSDGVDMPAEITLPNVKIQSNFTFNMAATGDPSTFTFTMDAFPGYTMFDRTKKVLMVMQIVEDANAGSETRNSVMGHPTGFDIEESVGFNPENNKGNDSTELSGESTVINAKSEMFAQDTVLLGKSVSDMISADTYVDVDGCVNGTLKKVTGYTDFSSNVAEQEGYFFPVKLVGMDTATKMTLIKDGKVSKKDIKFDPELVLRIDNKNTTHAVEINGEKVIEFNFRNTKFE